MFVSTSANPFPCHRPLILGLILLLPFILFGFVSHLAASPTLRLAPAIDCAGVGEIPPSECQALVDLYNNTSGAIWYNQTNWMTTDNPCNWFGITCQAGHVYTITLPQNNLNGPFSPSIGNLTQLRRLELNYNRLNGNLPAEIGQLTQLEFLGIGNNELSGNIPPEIGNLIQLQRIGFGNNQLSGPIPPEIGNLTQLIDLYLYNNQLSGTIPSTIGNLTQLQYLYWTGNHLSGPIPPEIGHLSQLISLDLGNNLLSGPIPPEIGDLTQLKRIYLYNNQLSGPIPPEIGHLMQLEALALYGNQLSGSIPPEIGNLPLLQYLFLQNNQLSGSIPPQIGNFPLLQRLYLDNNQLSGSIPPEIGNLIQLDELQLQGNQLSGSIPAEIGNLTELARVHLENNQLSGSLPPEIGNLTAVIQLNLQDNQLSGSLPPEIGNLPHLIELYLQNNHLSGSIPPEISNLSVYTLILSNNQFSGLPPEIGTMTSMGILELSGNQITHLPPELLNLTGLQILNTHYNALWVTDPNLRAFLNQKDPLWEASQTIPPANVSVTRSGSDNTIFTWTPITYTQNSGYYEIGIVSPNGTYTVGRTLTKADSTYTVTGLLPTQAYTFSIRTYTAPHDEDLQQNALWSAWGAPVYLESLCHTGGEVPPTECQALGELYTNTNGSSWITQTDWLRTDTPCSWFGVGCSNGHISSLVLDGNQLNGRLPSMLGDLTALQELSLSYNQINSLPPQLSNLTNLASLDVSYNVFQVNDPNLRAFLNQNDPLWEATQTIPPSGLQASNILSGELTLSWTPITYTQDGGYYEIGDISATGTYTVGRTSTKTDTSYTLLGLIPDHVYHHMVRTCTLPHDLQRDVVCSQWSSPVPLFELFLPIAIH